VKGGSEFRFRDETTAEDQRLGRSTGVTAKRKEKEPIEESNGLVEVEARHSERGPEKDLGS